MWCHSIARLSKTGYCVVYISQLYNYLIGCSVTQEMIYACLRTTSQAVISVIGLNLVELLRNWTSIQITTSISLRYINNRISFFIILSLHCEWLQSLSTKKCTYYTNIYFTLSHSYMFGLPSSRSSQPNSVTLTAIN